MNKLVKKYILSTLFVATGFTVVNGEMQNASAETLQRACPFSCRTLGLSNDPSCHDSRRGDTCYVKTDSDTTTGSSGNNSASTKGGQKVCVSAAGEIVTRGKCRSSETVLTTSLLPSFADISLRVIPSGKTIYGVIGQTLDGSAAGALSSSESLNAILPVALGVNDIIVATTTELSSACSGASNCLSSEELADSANCIGSVTAPSAPSGKVCIYPATINNASQIRAVTVPENSGNAGISMGWTANTTGASTVQGVWAYKAP